MNSEVAVVIAIVLALIVVSVLFAGGSELINLGESTLFGYEENVSDPDDEDHWWMEEDNEETSSTTSKTGLLETEEVPL